MTLNKLLTEDETTSFMSQYRQQNFQGIMVDIEPIYEGDDYLNQISLLPINSNSFREAELWLNQIEN